MSKLAEKVAQIKLRHLLGIWAILVVARVTIFSSGGFGGLVSVVATWAVTVGLLAISVQGLRDSRVSENAKYIFVIAGLTAFCYGVFGPEGLVKELTNAVWLVCIVGLPIIYIRGAFQRRRSAALH